MIGSRDGEGEWQEGTGWTSATGTEGTESTITRETVSRPGWREEGTPEFSSFKGHRSGI